MDIIQQLEKEQLQKLSAGKEIPDFEPGDTVIVNVKVVEGERTRIQAYEGVCIGRSGRGVNENFTVRKISYGEGVERVFPLYSPMLELDQAGAPRQGAPRQAVLPARPPRQVGAHRRGRASRRPDDGRCGGSRDEVIRLFGRTLQRPGCPAFCLPGLPAPHAQCCCRDRGWLYLDHVQGLQRSPDRSRRPRAPAGALFRQADGVGAGAPLGGTPPRSAAPFAASVHRSQGSTP